MDISHLVAFSALSLLAASVKSRFQYQVFLWSLVFIRYALSPIFLSEKRSVISGCRRADNVEAMVAKKLLYGVRIGMRRITRHHEKPVDGLNNKLF